MAGSFGDTINNRADFLNVLAQSRAACADLLRRRPDVPVFDLARQQLDAIAIWTANGRTPTDEERQRIDFGTQLAREYDESRDKDVYDLRELASGVQHYMTYWPDDAVAADPDNWLNL